MFEEEDDDKTVRDFYFYADHRHGAGEVTITWAVAGGTQSETFVRPFRIGRAAECDVRLGDPRVSKLQSEIYHDGERWCVRDLGSAHGTYLNGVRVAQAPLPVKSTLQFYVGGPVVEIEVEGLVPPDAVKPQTVTSAMRHYFADGDHAAGANTRLIRAAFQRARRIEKRRYIVVIGAIVVLLLAAVGYALIKDAKLEQARQAYVELFYAMSEMKLQIAQLEARIEATGQTAHLEDLGVRRERLRVMEQRYDLFLKQIGLAGERLSADERIIFRVARMFGECELNMPAAFVDEVKAYIKKWQRSERLAAAIGRLQPDYHVPVVSRAMLDNDLPPQFLYLALQESNFDERAVGPRTQYGIAKGIWQFTPSTAHRFGLRTGPLVEMPVYDPADERFDFEKSTHAAGRYLRELYRTDAQASGLLVMASYNWGPGNIQRLIRRMPENPHERNFWKLIEKHKIPEQTRDFVFSIISAIVIGEDPALFGFSFGSPLAGSGERLAAEPARLAQATDAALAHGEDGGSDADGASDACPGGDGQVREAAAGVAEPTADPDDQEGWIAPRAVPAGASDRAAETAPAASHPPAEPAEATDELAW